MIFDAFILTTNLFSSAIRNLMFLPVQTVVRSLGELTFSAPRTTTVLVSPSASTIVSLPRPNLADHAALQPQLKGSARPSRTDSVPSSTGPAADPCRGDREVKTGRSRKQDETRGTHVLEVSPAGV